VQLDAFVVDHVTVAGSPVTPSPLSEMLMVGGGGGEVRPYSQYTTLTEGGT
jgi:hypothetical protein